MKADKKCLYFTTKAWVQMWSITRACDIEIQALGLLHPTKDNLVMEFYVIKQTCTPVYTDMDTTAMFELNAKLTEEGVDTSRLRVFMHSHVNMAASPSGTDEATFSRLANGAFLWSIITNKAGAELALAGRDPGKNMYLRLDTYDPVDHKNESSIHRVTIENNDYSVLLAGAVSKTWVDAALACVVKERHSVPNVTYGRSPSTYYPGITYPQPNNSGFSRQGPAPFMDRTSPRLPVAAINGHREVGLPALSTRRELVPQEDVSISALRDHLAQEDEESVIVERRAALAAFDRTVGQNMQQGLFNNDAEEAYWETRFREGVYGSP